MFIPEFLKKAEFALIRLRLEFQDSFDFTQDILLRLRRELMKIDRLLAESPPGDTNRLAISRLLNPPLSSDPIALRRYQKFAPLFAIHPPVDLPKSLDAGDEILLDVSFFGRGVQQIPLFVTALKMLGTVGIFNGSGPYDLLSVEAADFSGRYTTIWDVGEEPDSIAPPLLDLCWWLESFRESPEKIRVVFHTPTRLLKHGKPLFRPRFQTIFPYILRRVSSMLFASSNLEISDPPAEIFHLLDETIETANRLYWVDWKRHESDERVQELGGFVGELCLSGIGLTPLQWLLRTGSLMNIGKGSAFGNGHYSVDSF